MRGWTPIVWLKPFDATLTVYCPQDWHLQSLISACVDKFSIQCCKEGPVGRSSPPLCPVPVAQSLIPHSRCFCVSFRTPHHAIAMRTHCVLCCSAGKVRKWTNKCKSFPVRGSCHCPTTHFQHDPPSSRMTLRTVPTVHQTHSCGVSCVIDALCALATSGGMADGCQS
jgi:hypothetical protein